LEGTKYVEERLLRNLQYHQAKVLTYGMLVQSSEAADLALLRSACTVHLLFGALLPTILAIQIGHISTLGYLLSYLTFL
jgi:hypothetical protein